MSGNWWVIGLWHLHVCIKAPPPWPSWRQCVEFGPNRNPKTFPSPLIKNRTPPFPSLPYLSFRPLHTRGGASTSGVVDGDGRSGGMAGSRPCCFSRACGTAAPCLQTGRWICKMLQIYAHTGLSCRNDRPRVGWRVPARPGRGADSGRGRHLQRWISVAMRLDLRRITSTARAPWPRCKMVCPFSVHQRAGARASCLSSGKMDG